MPYIKPEDRPKFANILKSNRTMTPGELNYVLTMVLMHHHSAYDPRSYSHYNEMIGALECCKLELYRRMVAPYEDTKKEQNGDVY